MLSPLPDWLEVVEVKVPLNWGPCRSPAKRVKPVIVRVLEIANGLLETTTRVVVSELEGMSPPNTVATGVVPFAPPGGVTVVIAVAIPRSKFDSASALNTCRVSGLGLLLIKPSAEVMMVSGPDVAVVAVISAVC